MDEHESRNTNYTGDQWIIARFMACKKVFTSQDHDAKYFYVQKPPYNEEIVP